LPGAECPHPRIDHIDRFCLAAGEQGLKLTMRSCRNILRLQTIYYLLTATWPLVHIKSFMVVTGPKIDTWLVKTVAVLILVIAICFIGQLLIKGLSLPVIVLAISCCIGLILIECYYVSTGVISRIYLVDAFLHVLFLVAWWACLKRSKIWWGNKGS
jgi:hypothetical protein